MFTAEGAGWALYVMNADGSGISRLVPHLAYAPSWSPDGQRIRLPLRVHRVGCKHRNVDGSGEETLLESDIAHMNVEDWSADGETILFTRGRDVFLLRLRDRSVVRVTADGAGNLNPTFSRPPRP